MPQLDPTWLVSQLFWLAVTFTILYVVLAKLLLPKLVGIIERREFTISDDLHSAQRFKEEAAHARQDYETTLADARERAQKVIDDALSHQATANEAAAKQVDANIAKKLSEASKRIHTHKEKLMTELTPASVELAEMVVEKLTKQAANKDLVKKSVAEHSK